MTYKEYKRKREGLMLSTESIEVREKAIKALDESFNSSAVSRAMEVINASAADLSDVGN